MKSAYATLIFLTKHTLWSFSNQVTQVLAFTNFKHFTATFGIGKENISYLRSPLCTHTALFWCQIQILLKVTPKIARNCNLSNFQPFSLLIYGRQHLRWKRKLEVKQQNATLKHEVISQDKMGGKFWGVILGTHVVMDLINNLCQIGCDWNLIYITTFTKTPFLLNTRRRQIHTLLKQKCGTRPSFLIYLWR